MADPTNFLISTDYPMDKIVYKTSGSYTHSDVPGGTSFAHGLPFTPLVVLQWSLDSDFTTAYTVNSGPPTTDPTLYHIGIDLYSYSDPTNIVITSFDFLGGASTIYYRVFAFEPTGSTADCSATSSTTDKFFISTDYNHPKLFMSGNTPITADVLGATIHHGLGYVPQFEYWLGDNTTSFGKAQYGDYIDSTPVVGVFATDQDIKVYNLGPGNIEYRIYADEA